ncbi:MAG TPA: glycosyltransferase family 2 protein [Verrucomicrobiae bacterium]|nr:glycosyltransferase family 2 protein [Verrucomicrobiae bacterium]
MRRTMLPITVLIPTRNCAKLIGAHVESLNRWIGLAEEVVVVDSHSSDGTVEMIQASLTHPRIRYLTHPTGLYQSWNYGIEQAASKYVYVATVADSIEPEGIRHVFEVAETFQSDVVISKPYFTNAAGELASDDHWPIDEILECLDVKRPIALSPLEQFLFAATNTWGAVLGSSASNLYSAACLKARPFPTEFGVAGDCAWGILNAFDVVIAVTPERFSIFRDHEKAYTQDDYYVKELIAKFFELAQSVARRQPPCNANVPKILKEMRWEELEAHLKEVPARQLKLEAYRNRKFPWFLNPAAWGMRVARNRAEKRIEEITSQTLARRHMRAERLAEFNQTSANAL